MKGSSIELLVARVVRPILSIVDEWMIKLPASAGLVSISIIGNLFQTEWELIALLILAVLFDSVVGILASKGRGIGINSLGLRQLCIKSIEYFFFCAIGIGISNVFGETNFEGWAVIFNQFKYIDYLVVFYLILTELRSTKENLTYANKPIDEFIKFIESRFKK